MVNPGILIQAPAVLALVAEGLLAQALQSLDILNCFFAMFLFHLLTPGEVTDGVVTVFVKIIAGGILCKTAANLCWSEARNQAINESALVWKPHKNVRWLFSIRCSNIGFERCHFSTTHGVKYIGMCSTWTRQMNTFIRDLNEIHLVILSHNVTR